VRPKDASGLQKEQVRDINLQERSAISKRGSDQKAAAADDKIKNESFDPEARFGGGGVFLKNARPK